MSVIIPGMDMPKDGHHHLICIYADGTVSTGERVYTAISVPTPHGRLVDADELILRAVSGTEIYHICAAPTIIEAEEGAEE